MHPQGKLRWLGNDQEQASIFHCISARGRTMQGMGNVRFYRTGTVFQDIFKLWRALFQPPKGTNTHWGWDGGVLYGCSWVWCVHAGCLYITLRGLSLEDTYEPGRKGYYCRLKGNARQIRALKMANFNRLVTWQGSFQKCWSKSEFLSSLAAQAICRWGWSSFRSVNEDRAASLFLKLIHQNLQHHHSRSWGLWINSHLVMASVEAYSQTSVSKDEVLYLKWEIWLWTRLGGCLSRSSIPSWTRNLTNSMYQALILLILIQI